MSKQPKGDVIVKMDEVQGYPPGRWNRHRPTRAATALTTVVFSLPLALMPAEATPPGPAPIIQLQRVTSESPLVGLQGVAPCGEDAADVHMNAELEPDIAADGNSIALSYQQDRTNSPGSLAALTSYSSDAGHSFSTSIPSGTSTCVGGKAPFDRAGGATIAAGPDGTLYLAIELNSKTRERMLPNHPEDTGIAVTVSHDGGATWSHPQMLSHADHDHWVVIAADPEVPGTAYLAWNRHNSEGSGDSDIFLVRTTDGGGSWSKSSMEAPDTVTGPPPGGGDATTPNMYIGGVLPLPGDEVLIVATAIGVEVLAPEQAQVRFPIVAFPVTWSSDEKTAKWGAMESVGSVRSWTVRGISGSTRKTLSAPSIARAAVGSDGTAYVAWSDNQNEISSRVMVAKRTAGGTWSSNGVATTFAQSFFATPEVTRHGTVGIAFYDLRDDTAPQGGRFDAAAFFTWSLDEGATWAEPVRLTPPFDLGDMVEITGRDLVYVGDSIGMAPVPSGLAAALVLPNERAAGASDVWVAHIKLSEGAGPQLP